MCDKNTCYIWGLESCPPGVPNPFAAGESYKYMLHVRSHGTVGESQVVFNITAEDGTVLKDMIIDINVEGTSSTDDFEQKSLTIYPNPTTDLFKIQNDENISSVSIYNIIGKKILSDKHFSGKYHDVSLLQKGIYLVRIIDNNGKVVSVIRLNKN